MATGTPGALPHQLVLNTFFMRFGHHPAAWRHPSARGSGRPDVRYWIDMAKLAEQAKFDTFFLADFIGRSADRLDDLRHNGISFQFEPFTLLSAIARETKHIGLVATANTNFCEPYDLARKFASLDHISGGRAGWNIVSSFNEATGKNFGVPTRTHAQRYERAAEFVGVTKALWDSWDDDAFDRPDRAGAHFFAPSAAHVVQHKGQHFSVDGLLDLPRPLSGYPVLVQAGNSDTGREFAAEIAEMTYSSAQSLDVAQAFYADVKGRMGKYGRDPEQLKVTPGLSVFVGKTDQEARDRFDELQSLIDFSRGVNLAGVDVSGYPIDGPLPDLPEAANGKGRFRQLVELARRENLTIRQLALRFGVSRGHLQAIGSAKHVADVMQEWFEGRGADGFNVVPPLLPGGFEDFVRLVVPELQRRGIFRSEYTGRNYRENLGLQRPENQHRRSIRSGENARTPAETLTEAIPPSEPLVPALLAGRTATAAVDPLFLQRWSNRAFTNQPVSAENLRSLLEAARWAPSASNAQPWLFVYNDDEESLARARPLIKDTNRRWADRAPMLIFVFARKLHPETQQPLRTGAFDTGAAWFSLALQANRLGLITRAMGGIHHEQTHEVFGVPADEFVSVAAVAVGHPGVGADLPPDLAERNVPSTRKPVDAFAFRGQYRAH